MTPFKAPLDDILFTAEHAADAARLDDWDREFIAEIAGHFASFAEGEIAPLDEPGDRRGCRLENGRVRMPDGFVEAYRNFAEQGWCGLTTPEEFGGQGLGGIHLAVTSEIFTGACHALQMVTSLAPGAARTLLKFGTDEQKATYLPLLASGAWLATMCLTEPGAGSDLSRIRCKAEQDGDAWRITGEKIFISGGDQDMSEGILHLVLARTSDDGLKGLTLFACPSQDEAGVRNAISVTRIEEKMGLHASPTCQLAFDGATGTIIGSKGQGLAAMFTMMNHARADVALQGVAHAARATHIAKSYAQDRVQGRKDDGEPARLIDHADVARMISRMEQLTFGARAIAFLAMVEVEREADEGLIEYLTPLAKVFGTEAGCEAANLGIQVLGGYGYLDEYRVSQTFRDCRITAIYEGANGLHERMLATRLVRTGASDAFRNYIASHVEKTGDEQTAALLDQWVQTRDELGPRADHAAHEFYLLTANTLLSMLWHRMGEAAENHEDPAHMRSLAQQARTECRIAAAANVARIEAITNAA